MGCLVAVAIAFVLGFVTGVLFSRDVRDDIERVMESIRLIHARLIVMRDKTEVEMKIEVDHLLDELRRMGGL